MERRLICMNELVKSLADQAKQKVPGGLFVEQWIERYNEEFARLIVHECVTVMYDNAIERKVPPDIDKTPTQYAIAILEHFGENE
jgi:hypothetical protein